MIFLLFFLGSCARQPASTPGRSDGPLPGDSAGTVSAKLRAERWKHFDELDDLEVLTPSFRSRGHGTGEWRAQLQGSQGVGAALDALVPGQHMPVGSLLVQRHEQRQLGVALGLFAMEKRTEGYFSDGGDWAYFVVGRDGRLEASGKLASCARCHAESPVDFVFPRVIEEPPDGGR